ncbi:unnamed protein product [Gongylonema pulchrum]|uniref:Uncharacterized protein n=1 Tax=Gongylonema pulchrum TaxID=637853 RepID=A0A183D0P0_9BILA|nr:unnamed protein product [Gongylonema pulchrum]
MNTLILILLIIVKLSLCIAVLQFGYDANNQLYFGDGINGIFLTCHGFGCREYEINQLLNSRIQVVNDLEYRFLAALHPISKLDYRDFVCDFLLSL